MDIVRLAGALAALLLAASPALAHPHVWVTTKAELVYAPDGRISAVRHAWTFDEGYSAFAIQGLEKGPDGAIKPDQLKELAKTNTESLADNEYFTIMKANGAPQSFAPPRDPIAVVENGQITLRFELPLKSPALSGKALVLEVRDPTFFVDFRLGEGDAVTLKGAPTGCVASLTRAKPMPSVDPQNLSESFFKSLTASANLSAQFTNRALVACP
jgi:ABC-type uncharacterized transport system substrate-binding protein